jgi:Kef-type K+ transport system membrane component KefB
MFVNIGILPTEMPIFIKDFAELGIIIIMFAIGFEEETGNFLSSIKRSWGIAFFGAVTPFAIAYSAAYYFWGGTNNALMCGLAMTATAVSLTVVSLKTEGLSKLPDRLLSASAINNRQRSLYLDWASVLRHSRHPISF